MEDKLKDIFCTNRFNMCSSIWSKNTFLLLIACSFTNIWFYADCSVTGKKTECSSIEIKGFCANKKGLDVYSEII